MGFYCLKEERMKEEEKKKKDRETSQNPPKFILSPRLEDVSFVSLFQHGLKQTYLTHCGTA